MMSLRTGRIATAHITNFVSTDPKPRTIHKAAVRDRIVHHVIYKALAPIFEAGFIADSFSCQIGKGTHRAVNRLKIFLDKVSKTNKTCFVLKCDVRKFFQSIDHEILLEIVSQKIRDRKMMNLVVSIANSFNAAPVERERERMPDRQSHLSAFWQCVT